MQLYYHDLNKWKEKEMATHSSVLAWRKPGTGEPGKKSSMGSHRVAHDWSDLAAVAEEQVEKLQERLMCPKSTQFSQRVKRILRKKKQKGESSNIVIYLQFYYEYSEFIIFELCQHLNFSWLSSLSCFLSWVKFRSDKALVCSDVMTLLFEIMFFTTCLLLHSFAKKVRLEVEE